MLIYKARDNTSVEKCIVPLQKGEGNAYTVSLGMTYLHCSCCSLLQCQFALKCYITTGLTERQMKYEVKNGFWNSQTC